MNNLIVYGSLVNKDELLKEGISLFDVELVKVFNFRRVFNQEPSYRLINSLNRSVLSVKEEEGFWFNAIVIKNLTDEYFETLDIREKGYNRIYLEENRVKTYNNNIVPNSVIYIGKEQKKNEEILPNFDYLNICLHGAESFGKEFLNDFLKTTYKNSEEGLTLI